MQFVDLLLVRLAVFFLKASCVLGVTLVTSFNCADWRLAVVVDLLVVVRGVFVTFVNALDVF